MEEQAAHELYTEFAAVDAGARFKQARGGLILRGTEVHTPREQQAGRGLYTAAHRYGVWDQGVMQPPATATRPLPALQGIGFAGRGAPRELQGWVDKDDDDVIARNRRLFGGDRGQQVGSPLRRRTATLSHLDGRRRLQQPACAQASAAAVVRMWPA